MGMNRSYIWRNIGQNSSKLDENYKFTALTISKYPQIISMKTTTARHIRINLLKTNDKDKILQAEQWGTHHLQKNKDKNDSRYLLKKKKKNTVEYNLFSIRKKILSN